MKKNLTVGFGVTGSFCTFHTILPAMEELVLQGYDLLPILSFASQTFDTRFTPAAEFSKKVTEITGHSILTSIVEAEPIGPKGLLDAMIIAPATGNTLAKLANGITDTPVLMAAKGQLRNGGPLLLFVSTNDGLGLNLKNIGLLMNSKHVFFVPFRQDAPTAKPTSLVSLPSLIPDALSAALSGNQLQPVLA